MASRDHCMYLKEKLASDFKDSTDLYSNFTLSNGHKCTTALDHQRSKNVEIGSRKGLNYDVIEKTASQKDSISLKKSYKNLPKDYFNSNLNDGKKESKTEKGPNKSKNASTLSLHIAAYENFVETQANDSFDGKELRNKGATTKVLKNREQQSASSFLNDQLEFPRQQEDENTTSEVQQFAASQRLFAPKQEPFSSSVVSLSSSAQIPEGTMITTIAAIPYNPKDTLSIIQCHIVAFATSSGRSTAELTPENLITTFDAILPEFLEACLPETSYDSIKEMVEAACKEIKSKNVIMEFNPAYFRYPDPEVEKPLFDITILNHPLIRVYKRIFLLTKSMQPVDFRRMDRWYQILFGKKLTPAMIAKEFNLDKKMFKKYAEIIECSKMFYVHQPLPLQIQLCSPLRVALHKSMMTDETED